MKDFKIVDFIKAVKEKIDLEKNDIDSVSKKIPNYYCACLTYSTKIAKELIDAESKYTEVYAQKIEYYINEHNLDIFKKLTNKEDREKYINGIDKELTSLKKCVNIYRSNIETVDSIMKMLKDAQFSIKNILEWEKFKRGG